MVKTVCGTVIDEEGMLVTASNKAGEPVKAVVLHFKDQKLYFCEESCKEEFLNAQDKDHWMENHQ